MCKSAVHIRAPGKVNLFLELRSKRSDGFHDLETVIVSLGLHDELVIRRRDDEEIHLCCDGTPTSNYSDVPVGPTNLVVKAIELFRSRYQVTNGFDVRLFKRIPSQAGLGGGSSDAAAALVGVNQLMGMRLSKQQLAELAAELGSDVAYFLFSSLARCTGRGEKVEPYRGTARFWMVLGKPSQGLSTPDVYRNSQVPDSPNSGDSMLQSLRSGSTRHVARSMFNRLQLAAEKLCPWIGQLKDEFAQTNCLGHQMTGSGSGYFGIYHNKASALIASRQLKSRLPNVAFF